MSGKATEKNKDNIYSETLTNSAEFGIINQREFFDKDISNKRNLSAYYIVHPDYFVYNPRISNFAPVGPIKRNKLGRTGVMSPLYYVFKTYNVNKTYLEYYFSGSRWHRFMILNGDSGARSDRFSIKDSTFSEMPIPVPSDEEQIKIGGFLKQLDTTIALHQRKLDKLKLLKKAYLQVMFPQEDEVVPRLRFADYNDEWEQRKFTKIINRVSKQSNDNNLPKVEFSDIVSGEGRLNKDISQKFDDRRGTVFEPGFILYGKLRPYLNNWLFPNFQGIALGDFWVFESNNSSPIFNYYLIQTREYQKVANLSTGTKMPRSDWNTVSETVFKVPSINEQTQVGNLVKKLDETIALHQAKWDRLQEIKKVFLQKMIC